MYKFYEVKFSFLKSAWQKMKKLRYHKPNKDFNRLKAWDSGPSVGINPCPLSIVQWFTSLLFPKLYEVVNPEISNLTNWKYDKFQTSKRRSWSFQYGHTLKFFSDVSCICLKYSHIVICLLEYTDIFHS